jgi:hypothetical protein
MSRFRLLPGSALLAVLTAATASAQPSSGRHTLTGFAGVHLFDLGNELEDRGSELQTEVDFGGRYQYNVDERWAVEWNVAFSPGMAKLGNASGRSVDVNVYHR